MFTLILSDFKSKLKSPITWLLIILLCTLSGLNLLEAQKEQATRPFVEHNVIGFNSMYKGLADIITNDKQRVAYPIAYESLKLIDNLNLEGEKATIEKNYREMTRVNSFYNLVMLKHEGLTRDPISDIMIKNDIYDMWVDVSNGIPYESVDFRPVISGGKQDTHRFLLSGKYYHNLYVNRLEPIYNDEINNVTAIYGYFFKAIPMMIFLIIILCTYNNINKEKRTGTLKLILTQSVNRSRYYISKWISSVLHILTIVLTPIILMSTLAGWIGGHVTFRYPVFYLSKIFTRFKPIPNYFDRIEKAFTIPELYPRVFGHIAPGHFGDRNIDPHSGIDIIPFYKYLFIVLVLLVLLIMFVVAFVQLISAIIDHEIISLVVTSVLVGGLTYISLPFTQERAYNMSPFTFFKVSRIVEGTYNVTVLTSILVMVISTIVLLVLGCIYFKKKPI